MEGVVPHFSLGSNWNHDENIWTKTVLVIMQNILSSYSERNKCTHDMKSKRIFCNFKIQNSNHVLIHFSTHDFECLKLRFHEVRIWDFRFDPSRNEWVERVLRNGTHGRANSIKILFGHSIDNIIDIVASFWYSKDWRLISKMSYWSLRKRIVFTTMYKINAYPN